MCKCLEEICHKYSKLYARDGRDACVKVHLRGEIAIKQFVQDRKSGKFRMLGKFNHAAVEFNFCPICGEESSNTSEILWYDEDGNRVH